MEETHHWTTFLAALGSEKSLAYWHNLKLPVERNQYQETIAFARGCMELFLYSQVEKNRQLQSIQQSWESYRKIYGVLDEEFIEKHQVDFSAELNVKKVFNEVAAALSFDKAEELYTWAKTYFRDDSDSIIEAAARLKFLLDDSNKENHETVQKIEVSEDLSPLIRKFCNHIEWRNTNLRTHFFTADNVYRMTLPDEWEMLLQDVFYEGVRDSYWWMNSVEYSLQFVNFYRLWKQLKENIGTENVQLLIEWLQKSMNNLPGEYYRLKDADLNRLNSL